MKPPLGEVLLDFPHVGTAHLCCLDELCHVNTPSLDVLKMDTYTPTFYQLHDIESRLSGAEYSQIQELQIALSRTLDPALIFGDFLTDGGSTLFPHLRILGFEILSSVGATFSLSTVRSNASRSL